LKSRASQQFASPRFRPLGTTTDLPLGMATEWLRLKDEEQALTASKRRDEREERTLSIARRANTIAIIAMIFSTITAIVSIAVAIITASDNVISFLRWLRILKP